MRLRLASAVLPFLLLSAIAPAHAVRPADRPDPFANGWARPSGGAPAKALRQTPRVAPSIHVTPAWQRFRDQRGGRWQALWDGATAVPSRLWGDSIHVPGASADPRIAERAAREVIAAHLDLLAPGADMRDFVLVSNRLDRDLRTVGFVQTYQGARVLGGQVSVRIKRDRIFVLSSQALPHVHVPAVAQPMRLPDLAARAQATLPGVFAADDATVALAGDATVFPMVTDDGVQGYRLVRLATVTSKHGLWRAAVDVHDGTLIAGIADRTYATGTLSMRAVNRHPGRGRVDIPAALVDVTVDGTATRADANGLVTWAGEATTALVATANGARATVTNLGGAAAVAALSLAPNGGVVWDASANEFDDAQVQAQVYASRVREYARTFAPDLAFLNEPVIVNVNINDTCNAFSDFATINFFRADAICQNTALLEDVIYHEYGHSLHRAAIIEGVGGFDGGMSEGASDFLSALITGDSGMGRGFFLNDDPLRELNPPEREQRFPEDLGEVHYSGLIFGGVFWDLRTELFATLGEELANPLVQRLFYATLQRSTDIGTTLIEVLAEDDDDGDLGNGTPNECLIRRVWALHGMRTLTGEATTPGLLPAASATGTLPVEVRIVGLNDRCEGEEVLGVTANWGPGNGYGPTTGQGEALGAEDLWQIDIPLPNPGGRVDYRFTAHLTDGDSITLPDNRGDPNYQSFRGDLVTLYCTNFDGLDPFAYGFSREASRTGGDPIGWEWGPPSGLGLDPPQAYSGANVMAIGLGRNYTPDSFVVMALPPIDVGQYTDVHVQFRRWLTVEDGYYDQAQIRANGEVAWGNLNSNEGDSSSTHSMDREWVFQSIPLSARFAGPELNVSFSLATDAGLEFGGWAIDDLCVVANPAVICGDGVRALTEPCDAGAANANLPDTCRTNCRLPTCGDAIVDSDEACEPGGDVPCNSDCTLAPAIDGGGCQGSPKSAGGMGLVLLAMLWRGRRRRQA